MLKRLFIDASRCDGCGICTLVCAVYKEGQWNPALSRIKVISDREKAINIPVTCSHCENPPCVTACLMNVITKDPVNNNLTVRNLDNCIGCRACEISCPFAAAAYNYIKETVVNCDLCDGDPQCVYYCPANALQFLPADEALARKRNDAARHSTLEGMQNTLELADRDRRI